MKTIYILLLSIVLCTGVTAQNDPQQHTFTKDFASAQKIRSVKVIVLFAPGNDSCPKFDTGSVDIQNYDASGRITSSFYSSKLDKNDYKSEARYSYSTDGTLLAAVYHDGIAYDSIYHYDAFRFYEFEVNPNFSLLRELGADSVLKETKMTKKDTMFHSHKYEAANYIQPSSGDYHVGVYHTSVIHADQKLNTDTCDYLNANGEVIFRAVNSYDANKNPTKTELYNFGDKNARGFSARYNSRLNMSDWVPISKKGQSTYSISRTYNSAGLIAEKRMQSTQKHFTPVIVRYVYEFYN